VQRWHSIIRDPFHEGISFHDWERGQGGAAPVFGCGAGCGGHRGADCEGPIAGECKMLKLKTVSEGPISSLIAFAGIRWRLHLPNDFDNSGDGI
jgi:hypothetical protein